MNNKQRALQAKTGVYFAHSEELKAGETCETCMQDFLINFIHLCDLEKVDFEGLLDLAYYHYREELKEEPCIQPS
jgi:hypothetical protein